MSLIVSKSNCTRSENALWVSAFSLRVTFFRNAKLQSRPSKYKDNSKTYMSLSVTDSYQFSPLVLSLGHPTRQLISPATKVFESFNLALLTSPIGSNGTGNESDSFS